MKTLPHAWRSICLTLLTFIAWPSLARAEAVLSLAGDWRFEIAGAEDKAFARVLPGKIRLPGTMDDAGLGPKNTKAPTLEGPYRLYDYAGPAWYQRDIEIPQAWQGKRVALFLERCRWVTTVWLDDQRIGSQDSLIAPHEYDFGVGVKPGKHRLTVCVDNTVKLNMGKFVSALFGGTWGNMNGIVGRIELRSTAPVWIQDVQIYPDVEKKQAKVKVKIGNLSGKSGTGNLFASVANATDPTKDRPASPQPVAVKWDEHGGSAEFEIAPQNPAAWDEFQPQLYQLGLNLLDLAGNGKEFLDTRSQTFGLRKIASQGTQLTLNGRPIFLRGTLECSVFPLTGYPPTDVPSWQKICRVAKSYGLNHLRFHSWCPPEAAFAAADIEGIIIQAEGPQANVPAGADATRDAFIEAEFKRIVDTYGNHPSFCLMALGNEYGGDQALLDRWVDLLKARDTRHLYTSASNNRQRAANRDFTVMPQGRGITSGNTLRDLRDIVAKDARPTLGHEIGQWMFYPDFNEMKKYTGVMAVKNFEMIRDHLKAQHLLDQAPQFVQASGQFAVRLYKEEVEVLLRTPGYGGFALLDLHDYPTQGTALIGPLDPFWESKGFITPEQWRHFCSATVPLARLAKRTFATDEKLDAELEVAHFGPAPLKAVPVTWQLLNVNGKVMNHGALAARDIPTGALTPLGKVQVDLSLLPTPARYQLAVKLGQTAQNEWDLWCYAPAPTVQAPKDITVCDQWPQAKAALDDGKKVVFFPQTPASEQCLRGRFLPVFWSPVWFPTQKPNTMGLLCNPAHPLFAKFPTDAFSDWQWYELMQHSRYFVLDDSPADYRPTVQVIDNFARNHKLGIVFEGRVGRGELLVCGFEPATKDAAAQQFLAGLYAYAASPAFKPAQALGAAWLDQFFTPKYANKLLELGAKVRASTHARDFDADNVIDGNTRTMWHTAWDETAKDFPHELIVELPKPVRLTGLTCLPRQDHNPNGWIKDYAVHVSADGKQWGAPIAQGVFPRNANLHTVKFAAPVETRFLKFVARSGFDATKIFASLAELSVLTEEK